ncbi:hypothetical protein BDW02DRAFT_347251 [Decorospora gaudefroyi]|uniref:Uncharacterized protein n=1 Tax=Decorospora gaudefroyi TaxID=184978 RepID=A0A6A5KCU8_9PLEO|nr:hypothetical protein BDW02DRAFT_347251 [Decorospora gaudefroyi]
MSHATVSGDQAWLNRADLPSEVNLKAKHFNLERGAQSHIGNGAQSSHVAEASQAHTANGAARPTSEKTTSREPITSVVDATLPGNDSAVEAAIAPPVASGSAAALSYCQPDDESTENAVQEITPYENLQNQYEQLKRLYPRNNYGEFEHVRHSLENEQDSQDECVEHELGRRERRPY